MRDSTYAIITEARTRRYANFRSVMMWSFNETLIRLNRTIIGWCTIELLKLRKYERNLSWQWVFCCVVVARGVSIRFVTLQGLRFTWLHFNPRRQVSPFLRIGKHVKTILACFTQDWRSNGYQSLTRNIWIMFYRGVILCSLICICCSSLHCISIPENRVDNSRTPSSTTIDSRMYFSVTLAKAKAWIWDATHLLLVVPPHRL